MILNVLFISILIIVLIVPSSTNVCNFIGYPCSLNNINSSYFTQLDYLHDSEIGDSWLLKNDQARLVSGRLVSDLLIPPYGPSPHCLMIRYSITGDALIRLIVITQSNDYEVRFCYMSDDVDGDVKKVSVPFSMYSHTRITLDISLSSYESCSFYLESFWVVRDDCSHGFKEQMTQCPEYIEPEKDGRLTTVATKHPSTPIIEMKFLRYNETTDQWNENVTNQVENTAKSKDVDPTVKSSQMPSSSTDSLILNRYNVSTISTLISGNYNLTNEIRSENRSKYITEENNRYNLSTPVTHDVFNETHRYYNLTNEIKSESSSKYIIDKNNVTTALFEPPNLNETFVQDFNGESQAKKIEATNQTKKIYASKANGGQLNVKLTLNSSTENYSGNDTEIFTKTIGSNDTRFDNFLPVITTESWRRENIVSNASNGASEFLVRKMDPNDDKIGTMDSRLAQSTFPPTNQAMFTFSQNDSPAITDNITAASTTFTESSDNVLDEVREARNETNVSLNSTLDKPAGVRSEIESSYVVTKSTTVITEATVNPFTPLSTMETRKIDFANSSSFTQDTGEVVSTKPTPIGTFIHETTNYNSTSNSLLTDGTSTPIIQFDKKVSSTKYPSSVHSDNENRLLTDTTQSTESENRNNITEKVNNQTLASSKAPSDEIQIGNEGINNTSELTPGTPASSQQQNNTEMVVSRKEVSTASSIKNTFSGYSAAENQSTIHAFHTNQPITVTQRTLLNLKIINTNFTTTMPSTFENTYNKLKVTPDPNAYVFNSTTDEYYTRSFNVTDNIESVNSSETRFQQDPIYVPTPSIGSESSIPEATIRSLNLTETKDAKTKTTSLNPHSNYLGDLSEISVNSTTIGLDYTSQHVIDNGTVTVNNETATDYPEFGVENRKMIYD